MTAEEFTKYISVLQEKPFELFPRPQGLADNRFTYADNDRTHVKIQTVTTQQVYALPLTLVEFANPGVLRLTREVRIYNGSFV